MLGFSYLASRAYGWLLNTKRDGSKETTIHSKQAETSLPKGEGIHPKLATLTLESVMAEFMLTNDTLRRMMAQMAEDMDNGLEGSLKMSTLAMLPSYVPELPNGTEVGKFLAMDLGGTNLRVMAMHIVPGEELHTEQFNSRIPNWAMHGTGEQLFDFIVKCLADFLIEKGLHDDDLPLGFTFSYPCDQQGLRSARLIRWVKGFAVSGVVGENVVELLERAIEKHGGIKVHVVALVNDTVGTLVAAAHQTGDVCDIGVIIGTGTNASYMEDASKIKHCNINSPEPYPYKYMIIDTEWGGFGDRGEADYIITRYDRIVDNRFDKLVAGKYMGELVRVVIEHLTTAGILFNGKGSKALFTPDTFPTKYISEILSDGGGSYSNTQQIMDELGIEKFTFTDMLIFREVCFVVSRRAANLGAAAIACVLNRIEKPNMIVAIDGSTYKYHPFFALWLTEKVKELVDPSIKFNVIEAGDGSGKGAALIAAIISRLDKKTAVGNRRTSRRIRTEELNLSIRN